MTWRHPRKRVLVLGVVALLLTGAFVSIMVIQNGKHMSIEVPEGKVEYIARQGAGGVTPGLPTRENEALQVTNHGLAVHIGESPVARLWLDKEVFPVGTDRFNWGTTVERIEAESEHHFAEVAVGDSFEYDGYVFRLTTIDARSFQESYAGFIIEKLPDDVTFFPSGDPSEW